jgi:hemoglobin
MCKSSSPDHAVHDKPATHANTEGCACTPNTEPMQVGEEVRWKAATSSMEFPAVPFPSRRIFAVAGEEKLRTLVKRHHERLMHTPVAHLFPTDPIRFNAGVDKTADFIVEATGGPACFSGVHGHTCMRTRHFSFTIDEQAREIWLAQLLLAFDDVAFPEDVKQEYWDWVESLSVRIINRRTMRTAPRRYPLPEAPLALSQFMSMRC